METDRRTQIVDAIITTLGGAGSRCLTHRAVDDAAGLPQGSTTYYFPTRASLIEAAVEQLAATDLSAVRPRRDETLAALFARLILRLRSTDRHRSLARFELALEAARRPELSVAFEAGTSRVRDAIAAVLTEHHIADAERVAADLMALVDGLLLRELTAPDRRRTTRAELERIIERLL